MADYSDIINFLGQKMKTGYDPSVYQQMLGQLKSSVARTGGALGVSAGQRFKRFGSPVIESYKAKLDRSRQQAVGRGITDINIAREEQKTQAAPLLLSALGQKKQFEMAEDQMLWDRLGALLSPAMALGGNLLYETLSPRSDLMEQIIGLFGGGRGGGGIA